MLESNHTMPGRNWAQVHSRLDGVDCLRALAIFYVLMNHVNMQLLMGHVPYTKGLPPQLVTSLVWQGQPGVQIFFAVSGFLITSTTIRRWGTLGDIRPRDFYLIRIARIAPLLLALLGVLSVLHLVGARHFVVPSRDGGLGGALFAALTFHIGLLEATRGYLPGSWDILWSLSVEEVFYLVFPPACFWLGARPGRDGVGDEVGVAGRERSGRWLVLFLLVFVMLGPFARTVFTRGNPVWQEYSYLGGMDAIALGCLTALFISGRRLPKAMVQMLLGVGLALLIFCLACEPQMRRLGLERLGLGMTLVAAGACMVMVAASKTTWRAPRLVQPLLAYGRRSYEVYLTHMFVVFAGFDLFVRARMPARAFTVLFAGVILLAGVLGSLVGRFYSEPLNRRLRARFGKRLGDGRERLGTVVVGD